MSHVERILYRALVEDGVSLDTLHGPFDGMLLLLQTKYDWIDGVDIDFGTKRIKTPNLRLNKLLSIASLLLISSFILANLKLYDVVRSCDLI